MRDPRLGELGELYPFESHYLVLDNQSSPHVSLPPEKKADRAAVAPSTRAKETARPRMHYVDEGEGPPVLLLHGNPTWSFYYRELIKGLRDRYRVIAPDHVGCGLSDKPRNYPYTLATHIENLSRLIDSLGLNDITLGVHDWGGPIGFGWAVQNPHRVRRLVIFNTAAFLEGSMPVRIRMGRVPVFGTIAIRGLNLFARGAVVMASAQRQRMTSHVKRGYLLPYDSFANRVAVLRFVQDIPLSPSVPSYPVVQTIERQLPVLRDRPMTIFWGMRDFVFTPRFLGAWTARFPNAEVHRFRNAGHYVVEDAHERILPRLVEFLSERPRERTAATREPTPHRESAPPDSRISNPARRRKRTGRSSRNRTA